MAKGKTIKIPNASMRKKKTTMIKSKRISKGTHVDYARHWRNFNTWVVELYPSYCTRRGKVLYKDIAEGGEETKELFEDFISCGVDHFVCERIKAKCKNCCDEDDLCEACVEKADITDDTHKKAKSAIRDGFKKEGFPLHRKVLEAMGDCCTGIRKTLVERMGNGYRKKSQRGARAMNIDLYTGLLGYFFRNSMPFMACFLALTWTTMGRGASVAALCYTHFSTASSSDFVTVSFPRHKGDQLGNRSHPKHLYCNAELPLMCPLFNLGVYLLCEGAGSSSKRIFNKSCPVASYRKAQKAAALASAEALIGELSDKEKQLLDLFLNCGAVKGQGGLHGIRKGATDLGRRFAHYVAVQIRGGWKIGGTGDVYHQYTAVEDRELGKGLSLGPCAAWTDAAFSCPPHFESITDDTVQRGLRTCFNIEQADQQLFFSRLLATVVAGANWLRQKYPVHVLFSTTLFASGLYDELLPLIKTEGLEATGITEKMRDRQNQRKLDEKLGICNHLLQELPHRIQTQMNTAVDKLTEHISEEMDNAAAPNTVTKRAFMEAISAMKDDLTTRFETTVQNLLAAPASSSSSNNEGSNGGLTEIRTDESGYRYYRHLHDGSFHDPHPAFDPCQGMTLASALHVWYFGHAFLKMRPLRDMEKGAFHPFPNGKKKQMKLNSLRSLVAVLERYCIRSNKPLPRSSEDLPLFMTSISQLFELRAKRLHSDPSRRRTTSYKVNPSTIKWTTLLVNLSRYAKSLNPSRTLSTLFNDTHNN